MFHLFPLSLNKNHGALQVLIAFCRIFCILFYVFFFVWSKQPQKSIIVTQQSHKECHRVNWNRYVEGHTHHTSSIKSPPPQKAQAGRQMLIQNLSHIDYFTPFYFVFLCRNFTIFHWRTKNNIISRVHVNSNCCGHRGRVPCAVCALCVCVYRAAANQ